MFPYRKVLEMSLDNVSIRSITAATGRSRQKITEAIKRASEKGIVQLTVEMTDVWLEELLFPELTLAAKGRSLPDFNYIHKELAKPGVTLSLLHSEYESDCRINDQIPYAYRTFCQYYTDYAKKYKATMRIRRKPGEIMEVDWAGTTTFIIDQITGDKVPVYVFVATLPCSQLSYSEGCLSMNSEAWIGAHNRAFAYFGGVTDLIIPDNLKTGVIKHEKYDVILNTSYKELATHYGTIVLPARIRSPKDKASVEGSVRVISTWIIASLRNSHCFSLEELNREIWKKLEEFNDKPFTKKAGSRRTAFEEEEEFALHPLPPTPYKLAQWKQAKVQLNYHVSVESMLYSVPYEYIQHKVDIRLTQDIVEIYFNQIRIATHKRLYGQFGDYSTLPDHMPDNHRLYLDHTPTTSLEWAETVGRYTKEVVQFLLGSYRSEKPALKAILTLQSLGKKYSSKELEIACSDALRLASAPSVKAIQTLLKNNRALTSKQKLTAEVEVKHGFTRGAAYFGGEKNDE